MVLATSHDADALRLAAADQEVVYHAAALTGAVDEAEFMSANRDGTANLARACVLTGGQQRFVLISSMAAGGPARRGVPRTEDGHDQPVTMYGRSKLAAEEALRHEQLAWTILRPPTVYGPRDRDNLLAVFRATRLGFAPVFGDGSQEVSLIHVVDLAAAIMAAGSHPDLGGRLFYVNHPEIVTSAALVRTIGRSLGHEVKLSRYPNGWPADCSRSAAPRPGLLRRKTILRADKANEFYQEAWTADPAAFVAATNWRAVFDMQGGIANTASWYRANRWI